MFIYVLFSSFKYFYLFGFLWKDKHRIIYQINTHGSASNKKQQQQTSGQSASTAAAAAGKEKKANEDAVSSTSTAASAASKADENKLRDAIRDVQVAHLLKLV